MNEDDNIVKSLFSGLWEPSSAPATTTLFRAFSVRDGKGNIGLVFHPLPNPGGENAAHEQLGAHLIRLKAKLVGQVYELGHLQCRRLSAARQHEELAARNGLRLPNRVGVGEADIGCE
jgi:hypothetical protein